MTRSTPEIVLVSSGHTALDHRIFFKEARSLATQFDRVRVVATHPRNEVIDGVSIVGLPPYRSRMERFLVRPMRCFRAAANGSPGPRVVILHDAELLPWVPVLKLLKGWRIVYDAHEDYPNLILRRTWLPYPVRRFVGLLGRFEKLLAAGCDGVMAPTQPLVDHFRNERRIALYNLPSQEFIEDASSVARESRDRQYDVVHLGTLSHERLEFLANVLSELVLRKPDARIFVIGVGEEQAALFRRRLPRAVMTIRTQIDYREIPSLLANCRIGLNVHPILYPHLTCAVPVKVFEYIAAGCGVVTSYLPELHRLLGPAGNGNVVTVTNRSPRSYAEVVRDLIDDPDRLDRNREVLTRLGETEWNWSGEQAKLIRFIEEIAGV